MSKDKENIQKLKYLAHERGMSFDEEEFYKIYEMLKEIPDVRVDKVSKVREQILSGNYNPPLKNIVSASVSVMNT